MDSFRVLSLYLHGNETNVIVVIEVVTHAPTTNTFSTVTFVSFYFPRHALFIRAVAIRAKPIGTWGDCHQVALVKIMSLPLVQPSVVMQPPRATDGSGMQLTAESSSCSIQVKY